MPPELSIVIPAYNEASRLGRGLARIREYFESRPGGVAGIEILVVDDGSGNVWQHVVTGAVVDNGTWRSIPITYDPRATTTVQPKPTESAKSSRNWLA